MKIKLFFIVGILSLAYISPVLGQVKSFPSWIKGTWHNSYESNSENFIFLTFSNGNIFIGKGLMGFESNRENLVTKYLGYKMTTFATRNIFKVQFQKRSKVVIYEFMLHKVDYSEQPVLTYGIATNKLKKIKHSTSLNLVLTK